VPERREPEQQKTYQWSGEVDEQSVDTAAVLHRR
jgi:hypothetical protein